MLRLLLRQVSCQSDDLGLDAFLPNRSIFLRHDDNVPLLDLSTIVEFACGFQWHFCSREWTWSKNFGVVGELLEDDIRGGVKQKLLSDKAARLDVTDC